jgi:hypothetical protein
VAPDALLSFAREARNSLAIAPVTATAFNLASASATKGWRRACPVGRDPAIVVLPFGVAEDVYRRARVRVSIGLDSDARFATHPVAGKAGVGNRSHGVHAQVRADLNVAECASPNTDSRARSAIHHRPMAFGSLIAGWAWLRVV